MSNDLVIKLREKPFLSLLDRDRVTADLSKHLRPWLAVLSDVVNYGTNLVPRCFSSSERSLKDTVALMILLRQCVAMLDAIEILLSAGASHAAHLQARALFEASIYLEWMLQDKCEERAAYYYVHNLRRKRVSGRQFIPGTQECLDFANVASHLGFTVTDELKTFAKGLVSDVDRVLAQPKFAIIDKSFDNERKGKRFEPSWYRPLGVRNLRMMSQQVGKSATYAILYSGASEVMHTANYEHHVKFRKQQVTLEPIRSLDNFAQVFRLSLTVAISTYHRVLQEYRSGELRAFTRKYVESWQKEFLNTPEIKYTVITENL